MNKFIIALILIASKFAFAEKATLKLTSKENNCMFTGTQYFPDLVPMTVLIENSQDHTFAPASSYSIKQVYGGYNVEVQLYLGSKCDPKSSYQGVIVY